MHVERMGLWPRPLENIMKIGHPAEKPAPLPATNGTAAAAGDHAKSTAASSSASAIPATADPSAKIEISSAATSLLSGSHNADFDADKVARISQAIDNGTFKINPEAIADKLISNAKELLTKT
jgi:negative regulator of flagellin synthesis FlgM